MSKLLFALTVNRDQFGLLFLLNFIILSTLCLGEAEFQDSPNFLNQGPNSAELLLQEVSKWVK